MSDNLFTVAVHDVYFTIGETVGTPSALFPDAGRPWSYTPPCVSLDAWPVEPTAEHAAFTTIAKPCACDRHIAHRACIADGVA